MTQKFTRFLVWMVPILVVCLGSTSLYGAPQMGDQKASAGSNQTVSGCVQAGIEPGGFFLTGEDGKVWELYSEKVALADHVGHTVTVTGSPANRSQAQEEKSQAHEKQETAGKEHGDLQVSSVKMVRESCSK